MLSSGRGCRVGTSRTIRRGFNCSRWHTTLGNFLRRLALPRSVKHWSLTTLREKLIKIAAKVVAHSGNVIFQMAEVAVPRDLFSAILERIQRFGVPPPLVRRRCRADVQAWHDLRDTAAARRQLRWKALSECHQQLR